MSSQTASRKRRSKRAEAIDAFADRFGPQLSLSPSVRSQHGAGEGLSEPLLPDAVLFAKSTREVSDAMAMASRFRVPVIGYGAGTSLEGQLQAVEGGLSIDFSGMNRMLSLNVADLDCRVEAGITREALNLLLRDEGLFFPLDPGANATIGGMAATRASGTNAVCYGTMREVTLGLTVVTPTGAIITTGGRARKSSAGYDLTRLYVGSEGTLGLITEVQLRLFGRPETIASAVCQFQTLDGAVAAVVLANQMGIPLARIELLDDLQMRACIAYSKLDGLMELPTLFLEFHGTPSAVAEHVEAVRHIFDDHGGGVYRWATKNEERTHLWKARHAAYHAAKQLRPGCEAFATDACVPISRLADCINSCRKRAQELDLLAPIVGHVGDGNFHMIVLFDPDSESEKQAAEELSSYVASAAIELGGTCTGEHGIGMHKRAALRKEHGDAVNIMATIKRALDPLNIMNPCKII